MFVVSDHELDNYIEAPAVDLPGGSMFTSLPNGDDLQRNGSSYKFRGGPMLRSIHGGSYLFGLDVGSSDVWKLANSRPGPSNPMWLLFGLVVDLLMIFGREFRRNYIGRSRRLEGSVDYAGSCLQDQCKVAT